MMKPFHANLIEGLIRVCFVLVLTVSQSWSAEPTLARLGFWVPPERMTEFETAYEKHVVPILKRRDLTEWQGPTRTTVDSVFSRMFVFKTSAEFSETHQALLADPKFAMVQRNLGDTFGTTERDGLIRMAFNIYRSQIGPGTRVAAGSGQGYWRKYGVNEGLAGNTVVSIFQDREKVLWFGSFGGGLTRYDGETFTSFTIQDGLVSGRVRTIAQDCEGNLWIGTWAGDGVSRYDGKTFTTVTTPDGQALGGELFCDREGMLWFGGGEVGGDEKGVFRYDGETFTSFTTKDGLASNSAAPIVQDIEGGIWFIYGRRGVSRYDGKTFTTFTAKDGLASNTVVSAFCDREGVLWFGTNRGVSRYDGKTFTNFTKKDGLPSNTIRSIYRDREDVLWVGTTGGVSFYDPSVASISGKTAGLKTGSQTFTTFTKQDGLAGPSVWSILQDHEGALWFGTRDGGVSRYDKQTFATFTTQNGLVEDRVTSIAQDGEGRLWFGTQRGVSRYDGKTFTNFTSRDGLGHSSVRSIFKDREGALWFGAERSISRYDGETVTNFTALDGLDRSRLFTSIAQDREGAIWAGGYDGLSRYDGEGVTTITAEDGLPANRVNSIFKDRDGMLWFGSSGLIRYDGETITKFTTKDGLPHNGVAGILQDREGLLWFRTFGGLIRYDGETFTTIAKKDGLDYKVSRSMLQDQDGVFWFGTRAGVIRYDGQVSTTLTTKDGLVDNNVNSIFQDQEGSIWFGTEGGVTRYRQPAPVPPSVFIDVVLADRRYEGASDIAIPSSVELTMFEFHGSSFRTRPEAMVYRYRLKGYEEEWTNTHARRVEYGNLPRGTYTFEVQAVDRDLVYSEAPATMTVNVHWPYERMGWMSSLGIALLLIGWQATRIVRRDQRLREANVSLSDSNTSLAEANGALSDANHELFGLNKELQENTKALELASMQAQQANQAKSRFLANMSHELRTPLNGILGYAQILNRDKGLNEKQRDGVGIIRRSGDHLLGLINDILDLARIEAEKVDLEDKEIGLPAFLKNVSAISGVKAQEKGLVFVYDAPSDLPEVVRGDPRRLRQVVLNLLGNAAKFTEKGEIRFLVSKVSQTEDVVRLRFEIQDTGAGMTEAEAQEIFKPFEQAGGSKQRAQGTGLGLAISQQLVGLMGGEIQVESTPGTGSRFWFEANFGSANGQTEVSVQDERVPVGFKGEPRQVLVVDDRVENRAVLISLLEPLGFKVTEAENGQVGLDLAVKMQPDLILLDLVMPVLDGFEATRRLRKIDALKDIVVIALSASVFEHERRQSLEAGCTDFLPKPVEAEDLLEKISQHLELEWTYDAGDEVPLAEVMNGEMVMPPADALRPLFEVAQKGQIFALDEQIDAIAQLGEEFGPFVSNVQKLAKDFKVDQICTLIKPHLGGAV